MEGHIRKRTHTTTDGRETAKWYVVVELGRTAAGRRRQKWHGGFRTRKEAEVARAKLVGDLHTGTYHEPSRMALCEWVVDNWLPTIRTQVKPSTFESYARNIKQHVLPRLGSRKLSEITAPSLTLLYAELLESGEGTATAVG